MAWRVSATYKFDDDISTLNVQYEQYQDSGAGSVGAPACELMKNRTGTLVGDPAVYPKYFVPTFLVLKIDTKLMLTFQEKLT